MPPALFGSTIHALQVHTTGRSGVRGVQVATMALWDFYRLHSHPLVLPLLDISLRGVRIDLPKREAATKEYTQREEELTQALHTLVGKPLDPHSPKQLMEYVYREHGVKEILRDRKNVKGERVSTETLDEDAIKELTTRTLPLQVSQALALVLQIRATHKLLATYLQAPLDPDGRLRCSYAITGTETGRLSSRETPQGTGTNLQNVPPGIAREIVIPDEGMTFVQADLSQAEARVVAYLAGEERLIAVFESGGDIHRKNAATIFRMPEEAVTPEQRQLAKKTVHAANYGMGPIKYAREVGVSKPEAQRLLNLYFQAYPKLKLWHVQVRDTLLKTRTLTTPYGRRRQFFGPWGEDLVREGLAYVPQSTVSDLLNRGLVEYHQTGVGQIVLQVHDSIVVQVPHAQVEQAQADCLRCLMRPLTIGSQVFSIPVTLKTGATWNHLH